jgi:hypothetical protein
VETTQSKLTVLFEEPFWIGIFERSYAGQYEACKVTFGAEPKENELYEFILRHFNSLRFSPPVKASKAVQPQADAARGEPAAPDIRCRHQGAAGAGAPA